MPEDLPKPPAEYEQGYQERLNNGLTDILDDLSRPANAKGKYILPATGNPGKRDITTDSLSDVVTTLLFDLRDKGTIR